jgi:hypothetical protein
MACLCLLLFGRLSAQPHFPNDLADWEHSHLDSIIEYKTANGNHWKAKLVGDKFIHAPGGDFSPGKVHEDIIIEYQAWDGHAWIAKLNGKGGFTHTDSLNPAKTHDDVIIGYQTWNGDMWEAILEDGQFRHARVITNTLGLNCGAFGPHHAEASCPSKTSHAVCDACQGIGPWGEANCHCEPGPPPKPSPTPTPRPEEKYYVIGEYYCVDSHDSSKERGNCTITTWNPYSCEAAKQAQASLVNQGDVCQRCPVPSGVVDFTRVWNHKSVFLQEGPCNLSH